MHSENCGRKIKNGAKYRSGAALVLAAVMLVLVLTGCGDGKNGKNRFSSPEEYYRHVESAAIASSVERLVEGYEGAAEAAFAFDQKVETGMTLELFKPAQDMLETYTGEDFSWLQTLGVAAEMDLAEDGAAMELSLALNGRELIGAELLADIEEEMLYGRIPLLSDEYFQTGLYGVSYRLYELDMLKEIAAALPDAGTISDILSRCTETALERVEDVKQGSDTLEAGGVSAKYTTLTVTLDEGDLRGMVKDVCKILKKDEDIEDCILKLEDRFGTGMYDYFQDVLDELPDRISLDEDVVMTLYVDEDDAIRGREIEYGDYVFRYAMPEDDGKLGLEISLEDTDDDEILWIVSGDGERDENTLSGTFVVEEDETEMFTIVVEDLDTERQNNGMNRGKVTIRPTYDYYTYFGVYSLTARALEDFSYTLKVEEDDAAFEVYMGDDPFLTLTVHAKSGPSEGLPTVSGAKEYSKWLRSVALSGGKDFYNRLKGSDLPPELLQRLFGAAF